MIIRHARIAMSHSTFTGDIRVEDGKIAEISGKIDAGTEADVIEADGLVALPGGIDAHTHMDLDVGFTRASDDFTTGTIAAACGGTTAIVDHMAFGPEGCALRHQLDVYHGLADGRAVVDYGFHGVLQHVDDDVLADMEALIGEGITSYKAYLTYADKLEDADVFRVLRRTGELGLMLAVHAENDGVVNLLGEECAAAGWTSARYHAASRPDALEAEAINRMLLFAHLAGDAPLFIVHLTNALGLDFIRAARERGQAHVYAETCPQYLLLHEELYDDDAEGLKYIMSPPLRTEDDSAALWKGLAREDIQTVGTDHCPFTMEQKRRGAEDFTLCPNGAPGVELRMALLFSEGVGKGRLTLPRMVQVASSEPARLFGIRGKGDIAVGMDADIVLFDPEKKVTVTKSLLHENVDYTPYEGMALTGWPVCTISRGEIIAKDGVFIGAEGRGSYLRRAVPRL